MTSDRDPITLPCTTRYFNDLIRPPQQRLWDRKAESFGGLEVDDELELGWLLDGKVTGLGAFKNLIDIGGRPIMECWNTRRV
jgi:hypothetical protein